MIMIFLSETRARLENNSDREMTPAPNHDSSSSKSSIGAVTPAIKLQISCINKMTA